MYWTLMIVIMVASYAVQALLNYRFEKYSKTPLSMTGREVAEKMLHDNGIYDVRVVSIRGKLTDHYDPTSKTVNLSEGVYNSASVAAAAVAAHECGHAVQHAHAYAPLKMRSALVPAVNFASKWLTWVLLAGFLLINYSTIFLEVGIGLYALTTIFSFVTLPVEIDASRRAVIWLNNAGITDRDTTSMARSALSAAAYTYVVAALASLGMLLYYISILNRRS